MKQIARRSIAANAFVLADGAAVAPSRGSAQSAPSDRAIAGSASDALACAQIAADGVAFAMEV